jgi:hypothetical protein
MATEKLPLVLDRGASGWEAVLTTTTLSRGEFTDALKTSRLAFKWVGEVQVGKDGVEKKTSKRKAAKQLGTALRSNRGIVLTLDRIHAEFLIADLERAMELASIDEAAPRAGKYSDLSFTSHGFEVALSLNHKAICSLHARLSAVIGSLSTVVEGMPLTRSPSHTRLQQEVDTTVKRTGLKELKELRKRGRRRKKSSPLSTPPGSRPQTPDVSADTDTVDSGCSGSDQ